MTRLPTLHLACLQGDLEEVQSLLTAGHIVDLPLQEGETPLMLATLMGHDEVVQLLLSHNADRKDALKYAQDDNLCARARRAYIPFAKYNPDGRARVIDLLSWSPARAKAHELVSSTNADLGFNELMLAKVGKNIITYMPMSKINTGIRLDRTKTIGAISVRSEAEVLMFAHSGWISRAPQNSHCLDNDKWNYIALNHIARLIHFRFPRNIRDNANQAPESKYDGRAWAGHVEVLLASWYCAEMVKKVNPGKSEDWCIRHLRTLKQPTTTLGKRRHAIITIDSQACAYCHKFINQLQEYTGIFLTIRPSAGLGPTIVRVEGRTRRDTFADNFEDPDAMSEDEGRGHDEPMQMRWQAPALNPSSRSLLIPEASRVPENSQELLERFRRGTPVHDFPGYPPAPRPLGQTVTKRHVREAVGNREVVSSSDNQFQQTHNNVTRLEFRLQPETSQIQNDGQGHQDFVDLTADSDSEDPHTSPEPWDEEANDYVGSPTSVENGPQQPPELMTPSENLGNGLPFWQRHAYGVEDHSPYLETPRSRLNRFRHEPSSNTNLDGESGTTSVYSQRFPFLKARFTR